MKPQFSLVEFTAEESPAIMEKFKAFCAENSMEVMSAAFIKEDGTISTKTALLKKVELIPKTTDSPTVEVNTQA